MQSLARRIAEASRRLDAGGQPAALEFQKLVASYQREFGASERLEEAERLFMLGLGHERQGRLESAEWLYARSTALLAEAHELSRCTALRGRIYSRLTEALRAYSKVESAVATGTEETTAPTRPQIAHAPELPGGTAAEDGRYQFPSGMVSDVPPGADAYQLPNGVVEGVVPNGVLQ